MRAVVLWLLLITIMGCSDKVAVTTNVQLNPEWTNFSSDFVESYLKAHPGFAVVAGRHEYDGQLPDWSAKGIQSEIERLHEQRRQAAGFQLTQPDQVFEQSYLLSRIDRDLFWLEEARWPFKNPAFYFDWMLDSLDPSVYLSRQYAPIEDRLTAYLKYLSNLSRALEQVQDNLSTAALPVTYIDYAVSSFSGLAQFIEGDGLDAFSEVSDPALTRQATELSRQAATATKSLVAWFERQRVEQTDGFALGENGFLSMLEMTEGVTVEIGELQRWGEEDLSRNLSALTRACAEYAPESSVADCVVKANSKKPQGGMLAGARRQLEELQQFVLDRDLVSVLGAGHIRVEEAPAYNRSNAAYIDVSGPFEADLSAVYYLAPPDPNWTDLEQKDYVPSYGDLMFTSIHEVWPGHFLQFQHANQQDSQVARLFVSYAYTEGWAHYAEQMMWEAGFGDGNPELHIGQLLNALLRNVRYLVAIGLHTKGMSVSEAEAMFRNLAFQDAKSARQQAVRGTYDPAYINYTLGKLLLLQLRAEWTKQRGGQAAWKAFHDQVLKHGGPPISLLRDRMM
ncbi:MAG: DUF885 domain-containing protein [Pseudomonadota bacterium]